MIKLAIKASLTAAAVYYVKEQGVWKSSDDAVETSKKIKAAVKPYLDEAKSQIPIEFPAIPETDNLCQLTKECWNAGVRASFQFFIRVPEITKEYVQRGIDALQENPDIKNVFAVTK